MLLKHTTFRPWLLAFAACLVPTLLMAGEPQLLFLRIQDSDEKAPAAAPPAEKQVEGTPLPQANPMPPAESTPMPPAVADGVAHVRSAACGVATCGPNRTAACNTCRDFGPNGCPFHGSISDGPYYSQQDAMIAAGRPYTLGDLNADICSVKGKVRDSLGVDDCQGGGALHAWWYEQQFKSECRRAYRNRVIDAWISNKLNYFKPSGCCGEGCPPIGMYSRVYSTDPNYYDERDQQLYASPVTGLPTAIPLAPNVRYHYNYSWGYPGSRLTPISTFRPTR